MSPLLIFSATLLGLLALLLARHHHHIAERRRAVRGALAQWLDQNQRRRALSGLSMGSPTLEATRLRGLPGSGWQALHEAERAEALGCAPGAQEAVEAACARVEAVAEVLRREIDAHDQLISSGAHRAVALLMGYAPLGDREAS